MSAIPLVITEAALRKAISQSELGSSLKIAECSIGDRDYTPNRYQTALQNERMRAPFGQVNIIGDGTSQQAVVKFSGPDELPIKEIALWDDDGDLVGVMSAPGVILNYKAKDGHVILPFTFNFSELPSGSVEIVVGTENLNILIDDELAEMGSVLVAGMVHRLDLLQRIVRLETK